MRKVLLVLPAISLGLLAASVQAQGPYTPPMVNGGNPYARPIFSPYLNLARSNNQVFQSGINYPGIIVPQQQMYSTLGSLQQQNLSTASALQQQNTLDQQLLTGHTSVFQNLSHYYPTSRFGGMSGNPYTMRPATSVQGYQMGGNMGGIGMNMGQTGRSAGRAPMGGMSGR